MVDSAQAFPSAWGRWSGDYPRDDTALLDRLRAGDDSALSALHERHVRVVHGVVTDLVAAQPDAEEVTHDACLTRWRKSRRSTFVGASCLPWLVVTADTRARELARPGLPRRRHRAAVDTLDRAGELAGQTSGYALDHHGKGARIGCGLGRGHDAQAFGVGLALVVGRANDLVAYGSTQ